MSERYLLGIDIGSSSEKVAVFDLQGNILALAKATYPMYSEKEGWFEQDADDYYKAFIECLAKLDKQLLQSVVAIGIGGQTPTEVFVDKNGIPIRRAIMWRDTRTKRELEVQNQRFSYDELEALSGCPIPKGANWTTLRLSWVKNNEPENANKIYKVLQAKDYLLYKLTGRFVTDPWSARPFRNINTGAVSEELLDFFGYGSSIIPDVYRADEVCGEVYDDVSIGLGLKSGTKVVCGSSDGFTSILSSGVFAEDKTAFNSSGTSEIAGVVKSTAKESVGMHIFPKSLTGEREICFGPTQSGGTSLIWLAENVLKKSYSELIECAKESKAGSGGLIFLPYIAGERAPIWNADAKGCFFGIKSSHTAADFARSVLEGVAFSIRHLIESTGESDIKSLRLLGGGSQVELWCQIRADVLGVRVEVVDSPEACAQGGAAMAGIGIGVYSSYSDAAKKMCKIQRIYEPNPDNKVIYDKGYELYRAIYSATKDLM